MQKIVILIVVATSLAACAGSGFDYKPYPSGVSRFDPANVGGNSRIGPLR